jgi:hypothetical protein
MDETNASGDNTLAGYVRDRFWTLLHPSIKRSVRRSYERILRHHVIPRIGQYGIHELTDPVFKEFARSIAQLGLPPTRMRAVFEVLKLVLELAHRDRRVTAEDPLVRA